MGDQHNELRRGGLSAALTRAVGDMRGTGGIERYGETLTPVLDLWQQPEWAFLRVELLAAYNRSVGAGGAGTQAGCALCNPLTSNQLLVVEGCSVITGAAANVTLYQAPDSTADLGSSSQGFSRDERLVRTSVAVIRYGTPAAVPANHDILEIVRTATTAYSPFLCLPVVLPPGRMLAAYDGSQNEALTVNWKWRERRAYPSELVP